MEEVREKIAQWLRVFTLKEEEGGLGVTPWNECEQRTRDYWLDAVDQILSIEVTEGVSIKDLIEKEVKEK